MTDGLLQRFSTLGVGGSTSINSGSSSSSTSSTVMPTLTTIGNRINQRTAHHDLPPPALLPSGKYPVYGPGTGPEAYDDGITGEYGWGHPDTVTGPGGGFFPSFLPWAQPAQGPQAHPLPPPPPPAFPPYPVYRSPAYGGAYGKGLRFKGASVAVLTLLAFLFFLSILQNYIRDYSTPLPAASSQPTVIVLSSGATKDNGAAQLYPYRRYHNSHNSDADSEPEEPDDDDRGDTLGPVGAYRVRRQRGHVPPGSLIPVVTQRYQRKANGAAAATAASDGKRQQAAGSGLVTTDTTASSGAAAAAAATQPYGDIFKLNGLML
ncbi:uncharacterized protein LOC126572634 [Anopheles aquasalis]|uniref:uncharacterized protein LOC126572634 n=1 Tax=Anopheles aquasalis TaxID=42839 RepID=UPI00215A8E4C|nr:uncharacterized protein LOC126572634 [Anopheles aquasalis]